MLACIERGREVGGGRADAPVFVVHVVAVARGVDDVETQPHAVLNDD